MTRLVAAALAGLMLVTTGFAGCIGIGDDSEDAAATSSEPGQASTETRSNTTRQAAAADEATDLVRETRELSWDGYMPEQVFVGTPAGGVYEDGPLPVGEGRDNVYEIGTDPMPVSAEVTLTYDDPEGTVHEMLFGIVTDSCERGCQEIIWKEGSSGMTISVDEINLTKSDGFAVTVHHTYNYYPGDVYYSTGPPVNFTVTGTYDVLVPQT